MSEKAGYTPAITSMLRKDAQKKNPLTIIYDPETKTILRRTCRSWLLIFTFYAVFYSILACFFIGMISVLMRGLIDDYKPLQTGESSILRMRPGLGIRPQPHHQSALIKYSPVEPSSNLLYIHSLDAFFNTYFHANSNDKVKANYATCKNGKKTPDIVERPCIFDLNLLGPCSPKNKYGYESYEPCVIIKLNKIYGWLPDIAANESAIRVECTGIYPADTENIGKITYYPSQTVNGKNYGIYDTGFFPYLNQNGYLQPIVGIQFNDIEKDMVVHVSCNIVNTPNTYSEPVRFEMAVQTTPNYYGNTKNNSHTKDAVVKLLP